MYMIIKFLFKLILHFWRDETGSFNLGVGSPNGGLVANFALHTYLYDSIVYRRWITQVALMFFTGRSDTFVWLDLKKQFRRGLRK